MIDEPFGSKRVAPLIAKLVGGALDGDSFELAPQGSILPPMRLSYAYHAVLSNNGVNEECGCWLNYQCKDRIPEWDSGAITYVYSGMEKMSA